MSMQGLQIYVEMIWAKNILESKYAEEYFYIIIITKMKIKHMQRDPKSLGLIIESFSSVTQGRAFLPERQKGLANELKESETAFFLKLTLVERMHLSFPL